MWYSHPSRHAAEFPTAGFGPSPVQEVRNRFTDSSAVAYALGSSLFGSAEPANRLVSGPRLSRKTATDISEEVGSARGSRL
jgi:hypothetical protein